jgi:hypothetical protein
MMNKRENVYVLKTVYQPIIVRSGVGVNRSDRGIFPEVGSILLYDFLSSYMPNCY